MEHRDHRPHHRPRRLPHPDRQNRRTRPAAEYREDTKLYTDRFGRAAEQLGHDKAAVRLAGELAADAPLFATVTGAALDRGEVYLLVRRIARAAGIPAWNKLSPHSLRHSFATIARARGAALEDVQDALGHADPRTTRRYDRHALTRDPSILVAYATTPAQTGRNDAENGPLGT